jgi:hypothetical protein
VKISQLANELLKNDRLAGLSMAGEDTQPWRENAKRDHWPMSLVKKINFKKQIPKSK